MANLTTAHCTLLAVRYASEHNVQALSSLFLHHRDILNPELLLRIVLTYLPESLEPSKYLTLIQTIISHNRRVANEQNDFDISSIKNLTNAQARKRVRNLPLLPLAHPHYPPDGPDDLVSQFIYHRAHRLEEEAGLLSLVPQLVSPFIDSSEFLKVWLISSILPLLRIEYEYYPRSVPPLSLQSFEDLDRANGVNILMSKAMETRQHAKTGERLTGTVARDLRGVVAPWMYGDNGRKRRKLDAEAKSPSSPVAERMRILGIASQEERDVQNGWDYVFSWIVETAVQNFALASEAIEDWAGPSDVDFGGYNDGKPYLKEEVGKTLSQKYGQAALASIYAVDADTLKVINGAHKILIRIGMLLNFPPPPDLGASIDELPKVDRLALPDQIPLSAFQLDSLLHDDHPLTTPNLESYTLLQMFTFSAYYLSSLGSAISIVDAAKLCFYGTAEEQLSVFRRVMNSLNAGPRKDEQQWDGVREKLTWLWGWGIDVNMGQRGPGVFGKIGDTIEKDLLRAFLSSSCYDLAKRTFILESSLTAHLRRDEVESVTITSILQSYDNASNGNRTRGSMKKASDVITAFRTIFADSPILKRLEALLSATHAMSFYSLTLQHGVPFQPVNIRVSHDPISLIQKILEQNPQSYTNLRDLISIAENLVAAGLIEDRDFKETVLPSNNSPEDMDHRKAEAESRVIGMAIDAALAEDDFETAYSYIVNRFQPPSQSKEYSSQDIDVETGAWRSVVAASKYRSNSLTSNTGILRRLDQRMDVFAHALLLAPPSALSDILNSWRRVEEEMTAQLAREEEAENAWDDKGDRLRSPSSLPGTFVEERTAGMQFGQPTREMGRSRAGRGEEEVPMGLFDVARGAAAAFNRTAFPLKGTKPGPVGKGGSEVSSPTTADGDEGRVRKRDVAYNAATNVLASGLGWVLGAAPVDRAQDRAASKG
ncbi:MAG: hypothetical protein M1821_004686 [Bathelium mastoideum]|nr:MAG: hypothetical protein M1821_004686 [Bathelium mastoideum]